MAKVSFLFSGQGAQFVGMGKQWYQQNGTVKALFDKCEQIRPGTLNLMFNGTEEDLKITANTQPALYLADLASAICAVEAGLTPVSVAGFSLGEIPALAFAGAYSYEDGFKLACKRGAFMQQSAEEVTAKMAAIVKLDNAKVEELCANYDNVYPVNYNCQGQLVVSGLQDQLTKFYEDVKNAGGRAIPLKVGGGFHSPFMNTASQKFNEELKSYNITKPKLNIYANRTADLYGESITPLLTEQINHPVKWQKTIENMVQAGTDTFVETGVGNVLTKLVAKINANCKAFACDTQDALTTIVSELK